MHRNCGIKIQPKKQQQKNNNIVTNNDETNDDKNDKKWEKEKITDSKQMEKKEAKNDEYFTIWGKNLGDFSSYARMIMPAEWNDMQMQIDSICRLYNM